MHRITLAVALGCGSLAGQKMLLGEDPNRQVAVFAVADLTSHAQVPRPHVAAAAATRLASAMPTRITELADFLRGFAARPGDCVDAVGSKHLVAIGRPDWIGTVESMLVHIREDGRAQFQVDLKFAHVPAAFIEGQVARKFMPGSKVSDVPIGGSLECVLDRESAVKLLRAIRGEKTSRVVQAPQITTMELDRAILQVGKEQLCLRGFAPQPLGGGGPAVPLVEQVWSGEDASVQIAHISSGKIGVSLDVLSLDFAGEVPGSSDGVVAQPPAARAVRARQSAEVVDGSTLVMAVPKGDGQWLLTMLTLQEIREADIRAFRRR